MDGYVEVGILNFVGVNGEKRVWGIEKGDNIGFISNGS